MNFKNIIPIITVIVIIIVAMILVNKQTSEIVIKNGTSPNPIESIVPTRDSRIAKVYLDNVERDSEISLPIELKGQAVGNWFFEASFPAIVEDENGNKIGEGIMQAEGEWMTEEHVPFKGELKKLSGYSGPAVIVLKKDNPSGEAQFDEEVRVTVTIK